MSNRQPALWNPALLTPAEQAELRDLREAFADDPHMPNLDRLNVLNGKATSPARLSEAQRDRHPARFAVGYRRTGRGAR